MKNYLLVTCLLALISCSKNNDIAPAGSYTDSKGTWIDVESTQWYLTRLGNGGEIHVKLNGTTNADRIAIRTSGDGLLTDNLLTIAREKNFSTDVVNSFSVTAVPAGSFVSSTKLVAYRGSDTLVVTLNSGSLKY